MHAVADIIAILHASLPYIIRDYCMHELGYTVDFTILEKSIPAVNNSVYSLGIIRNPRNLPIEPTKRQ